jgi:hypothetical protein
MSIHAEEERSVDILPLTVHANGLGDGKDMPFVEGFSEWGTPMP